MFHCVSALNTMIDYHNKKQDDTHYQELISDSLEKLIFTKWKVNFLFRIKYSLVVTLCELLNMRYE